MYWRFSAKTSQYDVFRVCIDALVPKPVNLMYTRRFDRKMNTMLAGHVSTFWYQDKWTWYHDVYKVHCMYRSFDRTREHDVCKVCIEVLMPKQVSSMFTGYVLTYLYQNKSTGCLQGMYWRVAAKTSQHDVCVDLSIPKQVNIKFRGYVSTFWCQSKWSWCLQGM